MKSIDVRYLHRAVTAANKFYRITHENPVFDDALECAGFHLNELGMNLFYSAILEYEKRSKNLKVIEVALVSEDGISKAIEGVEETYARNGKDDLTVLYNTGPEDCTCRRFSKRGICLPMIKYRCDLELPLFETRMFLRGRLLKDLNVYEPENINVAEKSAPACEPVDSEVYDSDKNEVSRRPRSVADKWHLANEITKEITENVSRYGGEEFDNAIELLECIQKITRTNSFSKEIIKYLQSPMKYDIVTCGETDVPVVQDGGKAVSGGGEAGQGVGDALHYGGDAVHDGGETENTGRTSVTTSSFEAVSA